MRFKTKDLSVSVSPNRELDPEIAKKLCIWQTRICIRPTLIPCGFGGITDCGICSFDCTFRGTVGCGAFKSCGGPGGSACDPTFIPCGYSYWNIEDPADLVTLREELNDVLQQVERLEKEGLPTQFQTREQVEQAEKALEGALEELRRQKKQL